MITAVDTSVLITIAKGEPGARQWTHLLVEANTAGDLVACDVVAAELFALLRDPRTFDQVFGGLGITYSPTSLASAQLAGRLFWRYRRLRGPREYLIPDFLVGAHASCQADRIAAIDRGYLRRYFPRLKRLQPR